MIKVKEVAKIRNSIDLDNLNYVTKKRNYDFNQYSIPIVSLKNMYKRKLLPREPDQKEQYQFT